jgi:hypothetical protein
MGYISEIFGFPPTNKSEKAQEMRQNHLCPFQGDHIECDPVNKKSNLTDENGRLLLTHQTGACSVLHKFRGRTREEPVIICPYRFLEKDINGKTIVFKFIKEKFFANKNIFIVKEIGLGAYGRADWMICEYKNENKKEIIDYAHLEFQADATTGTRNLVLCAKDFFEGKDITKENYKYGLNSKASIKDSSLQMIDKGYLFQKLGKKSIWVIQDTLFEILCGIYNIKMNDITETECPIENNLIFVVVGLEYKSQFKFYNLVVKKCFSTTPSDLQKAISDKPVIPEEVIKNSILSKLESDDYFIP